MNLRGLIFDDPQYTLHLGMSADDTIEFEMKDVATTFELQS